LKDVQREIEERSKYIQDLDKHIKNLEDTNKVKNDEHQKLKEELFEKKNLIQQQNENFQKLQRTEQVFRKEIKHLIIKIERSARQAAQCRAE